MPTIPIAALAAAGLAAIGAFLWLIVRYIRHSHSAEDRERRRRNRLHLIGRLTEATIYQSGSGILEYSYENRRRGVSHRAGHLYARKLPALAGRAVSRNRGRQVRSSKPSQLHRHVRALAGIQKRQNQQ